MQETNQYILYQKNVKRQNKKLLRKDCNKIGLMLLIATVIMNIVSFLLVFLIQLTGNMDYTMKTGISGVPYTVYYLLNAIYEFSGFFIVPLVFCLIANLKLSDAVPLKNNKKYNSFLMVIGAYSVCTIANFSVTLLNTNLSIFGIENTTGTDFAAKDLKDQIFYFVCVAIVPALVEEFMFRGVILNFLRKHGDGFALITSSFLFGLVHGNFVQIPFAFIVGLTCGFIVIKTGSILPSVFLHFLNNGTSVIIDITKNYVSENTYIFISNAVIFALTLMGFLSILSLCKKGLNVRFETKKYPTFSLSIKDKISSMLINPGIMIVISIYVSSALLTIFGVLS